MSSLQIFVVDKLVNVDINKYPYFGNPKLEKTKIEHTPFLRFKRNTNGWKLVPF
jgi:hypothetical protein